MGNKTSFKKGHTPWSKGRKFTKEHCEKVSLAKKGIPLSISHIESLKESWRKNPDRLAMHGKNHSEESKKKMSLSHIGKVSSNRGKKMSNEVREKVKKTWFKIGGNVGEKNHRYKKDRTEVKNIKGQRINYEYCQWRKSVYKRDDFTCRINNKDCCGKIETHHILRYSEYPELRYDINNGITLCKFHHPRKREDEVKLIPVFKELLLITKSQTN